MPHDAPQNAPHNRSVLTISPKCEKDYAPVNGLGPQKKRAQAVEGETTWAQCIHEGCWGGTVSVSRAEQGCLAGVCLISQIPDTHTPIGNEFCVVHHSPLPVDPNPPEPRTVAGSSSTSSSLARPTGHSTACAMRSPGLMLTGCDPRLTSSTATEPR